MYQRRFVYAFLNDSIYLILSLASVLLKGRDTMHEHYGCCWCKVLAGRLARATRSKPGSVVNDMLLLLLQTPPTREPQTGRCPAAFAAGDGR